ncbi:cytochrome P450, partial [Stereum hirsutum FP-91666 SS1]|uniref:cytochrome P450 n=1 Tax=Stereum hirsutum (strain FP-91666) TaxID=721885 RepID=UPI000444A6AD
ALMHDPIVYPQPEVFNPDRFNENDIPDPIDYGVFGYGRRSCAGKNMALDTVWIAMATILSVYMIVPAKDEAGHPVPISVGIRRSTINHPSRFDCVFQPRSEEAIALICQTTN